MVYATSCLVGRGRGLLFDCRCSSAGLAALTFVSTYKNWCKCSKIPTISKYCCTYKKLLLHLQNVSAARFCKQAKSLLHLHFVSAARFPLYQNLAALTKKKHLKFFVNALKTLSGGLFRQPRHQEKANKGQRVFPKMNTSPNVAHASSHVLLGRNSAISSQILDLFDSNEAFIDLLHFPWYSLGSRNLPFVN